MTVRSEVEGYDVFCSLIGELETQDKPVYIYFSGSKGEDGKSWCPDCVKAMPVVEKAVEDAKNIHFVYVGVGDRDLVEVRICSLRQRHCAPQECWCPTTELHASHNPGDHNSKKCVLGTSSSFSNNFCRTELHKKDFCKEKDILFYGNIRDHIGSK